jgi:hypothetical protein
VDDGIPEITTNHVEWLWEARNHVVEENGEGQVIYDLLIALRDGKLVLKTQEDLEALYNEIAYLTGGSL